MDIEKIKQHLKYIKACIYVPDKITIYVEEIEKELKNSEEVTKFMGIMAPLENYEEYDK